jgi:predicted ribosome quality control (RQC) complex YloA/Tae2 family protein
LLEGLEVREVQPAPPRDLLLVCLEGHGGHVRRLRLSADGAHARLHLQLGAVKRHEGSSDPFFARADATLGGCVLHALEQVQGDRIARLRFRREGVPVAELVAELTGRHANLLLLDGTGRLRARLVEPAVGSPAASRLAEGVAYSRPPGSGPSDPGPPLAEVFPPAVGAGFSPHLLAQAPLSARVEERLGSAAESAFVEEQRRELARRLERKHASAQSLVAGLEARLAATATAERVRQDAELLLAHLTTIPRGARSVELADAFEEGSPARRIELDPGLPPRRNAVKLFQRYQKLMRSRERLPEELARARAELGGLKELLARLPAAVPAELEREALARGLLSAAQAPPARRAQPAAPRLPYVKFASQRGTEIRVGRNAADNDRLTFRESNGNDLWLHTADSPGSHVVLRLSSGVEPHPEDVLDAAHLALHHSPLRGALKAAIHVARRKEVHKPRKAPPGLVTLSGGKTLHLRVDGARLERLLSTRGRGPAAAGEEA